MLTSPMAMCARTTLIQKLKPQHIILAKIQYIPDAAPCPFAETKHIGALCDFFLSIYFSLSVRADAIKGVWLLGISSACNRDD